MKLLVTVVVDELSVSWAHVDVMRKYLLQWDSTEIGSAKQSLKDIIVQVCQSFGCSFAMPCDLQTVLMGCSLQGSSIAPRIPEADMYILEEPAVGNAKSRNSFQTRSALTVAIATSLHSERRLHVNENFHLFLH